MKYTMMKYGMMNRTQYKERMVIYNIHVEMDNLYGQHLYWYWLMGLYETQTIILPGHTAQVK